jgi:hypothetical protein
MLQEILEKQKHRAHQVKNNPIMKGKIQATKILLSINYHRVKKKTTHQEKLC